MSELSNEELPGYNRAAVEAWVGEHVPDLAPPFTWVRLEGGHSNLTYELLDTEGREAVIRRPPMGELLPKAHDMGREFTIISALRDTPVPVANALGYCEDPSVTGAHFYVMSKVGGRAMYTPEDVEAWLLMEARKRMGESFIDTLAALHSVDVAAVGLDDLGRHDAYVARQLRTWYGSWTSSKDDAAFDDKRIHELHDLLQSRMPEQGPARVVHGDYGAHNCMVAQDGNLTAVLDWEIATLGDPLADFAYALNGWGDPGDGEGSVIAGGATTAPGFEDREILAERYAAATGADLGQLPYYRAFNYFKSACILHGVYARYQAGKKSSEGIDIPQLFDRMFRSIGFAERAAAEL
ncbi:MAG: phosphotransferase family protein [Actinomycetota bacterium]|nr:phosphotransferase family protein [Actinomycetota bacterium]